MGPTTVRTLRAARAQALRPWGRGLPWGWRGVGGRVGAASFVVLSAAAMGGAGAGRGSGALAAELPLNVLGGALEVCGTDPVTGFYRDGCCNTGPNDTGRHTVCCELTKGFLEYSLSRGNDLITPQPQYGFPGLKAGDRWCVCVSRWKEALDAGVAPRVALGATHVNALKTVSVDDLLAHALEAPSEEAVQAARRMHLEFDL